MTYHNVFWVCAACADMGIQNFVMAGISFHLIVIRVGQARAHLAENHVAPRCTSSPVLPGQELKLGATTELGEATEVKTTRTGIRAL